MNQKAKDYIRRNTLDLESDNRMDSTGYVQYAISEAKAYAAIAIAEEGMRQKAIEAFKFAVDGYFIIGGTDYSADRLNEFIKKLVELLMNHGIKKEDILNIFQKESDGIRVGDMDNGEFDFWVRFPEGNEDEYYYCFKDEGCHMIYHRFLPEDYADFGF